MKTIDIADEDVPEFANLIDALWTLDLNEQQEKILDYITDQLRPKKQYVSYDVDSEIKNDSKKI